MPSNFLFLIPEPPGKVTGLKVTETSYTHLVLTWTKPEEKLGIQDEAKGYFVEIRPADCIEWSRCIGVPILTTSFSVKGLKSMEMYWVRVIATNNGGESEPEELDNYVLAMPSPGMITPLRQQGAGHSEEWHKMNGVEHCPKPFIFLLFLFIILVRPKFTNHRMKSFVVVRAGNSVRITVNFEVRFILQLIVTIIIIIGTF